MSDAKRDKPVKVVWLEQIFHDAETTPMDLWIATALAAFINWKSLRWEVGQSKIAAEAKKSRRVTQTSLTALRRRGHIAVTCRKHKHQVNIYRAVIKTHPALTSPGIYDDRAEDVPNGAHHQAEDVPTRANHRVEDVPSGALRDVPNGAHVTIESLPLKEPPPNRQAARASSKNDDRCDEEATRLGTPNSPWLDFLAAYPFDANMSRDAARIEFEKLAAADQDWAVESAPTYRATLGGRGDLGCKLVEARALQGSSALERRSGGGA
jgi:hypothetical protein